MPELIPLDFGISHHSGSIEMIYSYAKILAATLQSEAEQLKKRERTRMRLLIAGCQLLDEQSLSLLTISQICKRADIAQGTFYLHFNDRHHFVSKLLGGFIAFLQQQMRLEAQSGAEDGIRATTAAYVWLFEANLGLMKCLVHHLEDFPETRQAFLTLNKEWADRVASSTKRKWAADDMPAPFGDDELLRRAYALGGLVDQYLTALLLHRDPVLDDLSKDRSCVISSLSDIWKQGLKL